jgi:hypothetical protein
LLQSILNAEGNRLWMLLDSHKNMTVSISAGKGNFRFQPQPARRNLAILEYVR